MTLPIPSLVLHCGHSQKVRGFSAGEECPGLGPDSCLGNLKGEKRLIAFVAQHKDSLLC